MTKERYFIGDLWNSYKSCREAVNHHSDCNARERNVAYRSGQTLAQRICVKIVRRSAILYKGKSLEIFSRHGDRSNLLISMAFLGKVPATVISASLKFSIS